MGSLRRVMLESAGFIEKGAPMPPALDIYQAEAADEPLPKEAQLPPHDPYYTVYLTGPAMISMDRQPDVTLIADGVSMEHSDYTALMAELAQLRSVVRMVRDAMALTSHPVFLKKD